MIEARAQVWSLFAYRCRASSGQVSNPDRLCATGRKVDVRLHSRGNLIPLREAGALNNLCSNDRINSSTWSRVARETTQGARWLFFEYRIVQSRPGWYGAGHVAYRSSIRHVTNSRTKSVKDDAPLEYHACWGKTPNLFYKIWMKIRHVAYGIL